eukprot:snap_masked-scaffold_44-processed-gene-0.9-mRNA-1 protein AED:1.00 eAED:1.00 QI:0/0/0/0/1/1/2/0/230
MERILFVDKQFGEDILFTVTIVTAATAQSLGSTVFVSKYISFHLRKMEQMNQSNIKIFGLKVSLILENAFPFLVGLDIVLYPMFILTVFVKRRIAGFLFYTCHLAASIRTVLLWIFTYYTINGLITDMKFVIKINKETEVTDKKFIQYCKGSLPSLKLIIGGVFGYSMFAASAIQETIHIYFWAGTGTGWAILSMTINYAFAKNIKLGTKLKKEEDRKLVANETIYVPEL